MDNDENRMDCEQVAAALLLAADDELGPDEWAVMETHLTGCAMCRAQHTLFRQTDRQLLACSEFLDRLSPACPDARVRLVEKMAAAQHKNWIAWLRRVTAWQWASLALAGIAFVTVATWSANHFPGMVSTPRPALSSELSGDTELIRIELPLSPVGNPFLDGSQAESPILADLVIGADGLPRGIRLAN